jgi:hypothetical protein
VTEVSEENARERQNIQYTRQRTNSPSNQVIWMANTNSPLQIEKNPGFGENVSQLSLSVYISHLNVPILYMISQKVVSPFNMSHLFMEDSIFGY